MSPNVSNGDFEEAKPNIFNMPDLKNKENDIMSFGDKSKVEGGITFFKTKRTTGDIWYIQTLS